MLFAERVVLAPLWYDIKLKTQVEVMPLMEWPDLCYKASLPCSHRFAYAEHLH